MNKNQFLKLKAKIKFKNCISCSVHIWATWTSANPVGLKVELNCLQTFANPFVFACCLPCESLRQELAFSH